MLNFKKTIWTRIVAAAVVCLLVANDAVALAPYAGTQSPAVRREMIQQALEATRVVYAASDDAKQLLKDYGADALLQTGGKILVSEKVKNDPLKLLRAIIHEEIEALMQIIERDDPSRYQSIQLSFAASGLPDEIPLNHLVASAFELLTLEHQGLISKSELLPKEKAFLDRIRPIVNDNRHNCFTGAFWDQHSREMMIRVALANGQRFHQVASDSSKPIPEGGTIAPEDANTMSRQVVKNILILESRLYDPMYNSYIREATAEALSLAYAALVKEGKMPLSVLESKLKNPNWAVRQAAAKALGPIYADRVTKGEEVFLYLLTSKLYDPGKNVRKAAAEAIGLAYTALINKRKKAPYVLLEGKLTDASWAVKLAAAEALGPVYAALIKQGIVPLRIFLERKLRDPNWAVQLAATKSLGLAYTDQANEGKQIVLVSLEKKLKKGTQSNVRLAAAEALGHVYAAQIKHGTKALYSLKIKLIDPNWAVQLAVTKALGLVYTAQVEEDPKFQINQLTVLESKLKSPILTIKQAAAEALGPAYSALINKGREVPPYSLLEEKLTDPSWEVQQAAAEALGPVYAALVKQGKMDITALENKLQDTNWAVQQAAAKALGPIYADLVNQGKVAPYSILENKLTDIISFWTVKQAAAEALGLVYAALVNKGKITDEDCKKYTLWSKANLPFEERMVEEYLSSNEPATFIKSLKLKAEPLINDYFDPKDPEQLWLAFLGTRIMGINIGYKGFDERVKHLLEFDEEHPGYFQSLFAKAGSLKTIEVSDKEASIIDVSRVNPANLDRNLEDLVGIKQSIDSLFWLREFPLNAVFKLDGLYYQLKRRLTNGRPEIKENINSKPSPPSEEEMRGEILKNKKLFYRIVLDLALDRLKKEINEKYLDDYLILMSGLIISDILEDQKLLADMRAQDIETRIIAFKTFARYYDDHLPWSAGKSVEKMEGFAKGLSSMFEELFIMGRVEISRAQVVTAKTAGSYRLIPQAFLSVFRGRAGIIDSSFDIDKGMPFARAMHEDTIYYFVYKGDQLEGYIGLLVGKTKAGQVLTIDSINSPLLYSPSIVEEKVLINLFKVLDTLAKERGCIGIALPENIALFFNPDIAGIIKEMPIYKEAEPIRVVPVHDGSWKYFTKMFGEDANNSIEYGNFRLLKRADLCTSASSPASGASGDVLQGAQEEALKARDIHAETMEWLRSELEKLSVEQLRLDDATIHIVRSLVAVESGKKTEDEARGKLLNYMQGLSPQITPEAADRLITETLQRIRKTRERGDASQDTTPRARKIPRGSPLGRGKSKPHLDDKVGQAISEYFKSEPVESPHKRPAPPAISDPKIERVILRLHQLCDEIDELGQGSVKIRMRRVKIRNALVGKGDEISVRGYLEKGDIKSAVMALQRIRLPDIAARRLESNLEQARQEIFAILGQDVKRAELGDNWIGSFDGYWFEEDVDDLQDQVCFGTVPLARVKDLANSPFSFVVRENDEFSKPIGMIFASQRDEKTISILAFSVAAACRDKGTSLKLLHKVIDAANEKQIEAICVNIRKGSMAQRAYEEYGFMQTGIEPAADMLEMKVSVAELLKKISSPSNDMSLPPQEALFILSRVDSKEAVLDIELPSLMDIAQAEYARRMYEGINAVAEDLEASSGALILYADDLLEHGAVFDLEDTLKSPLGKRLLAKDGKIILFARKPACAAIVEKLIKNADSNIEVISITQEELERDKHTQGELDEIEALVQLANAKGAKNILGLVKGRTEMPEDLAKLSRKLKVPVVLVGLESTLYSFAEAIAKAVMIKKLRGANGWVCILPPVRSITEDVKSRYEEYLRSLSALVAA